MSHLSQLSPDLLRTFVTVAEEGSFTAASKVVNRTQSAVSMQMRRLEDELGRSLFERGPREVRLTPGGQSLLPYARRILKLHAEALAAVAQPEFAGLVRLGSPDDYAARFLPHVLAAYARVYPMVQVYVRCDPSIVLMEKLNRGELDLAVTTSPEEPLTGEVIAREPVRWVVSRSHLVHEEETLPLAVYHRGCFYRQWAEQALVKIGREYRLAYVSPSLAGIQAAVMSGLAVAPMGVSTIPEGCRVLTAEEGFPEFSHSLVILNRAPSPQPPAVESLAAHVAQSFRELEAGCAN